MAYPPAPRAQPLLSVGYLSKALPAVLSPFDGWAAHLVVILWLINAATAALAGPVGLTYWLLGALFFFVPSLFAVAQLARLFPGDGGLYLWTYQALASSQSAARAAAFWSFFAGVCSWVVGPLALVTGASALLSFLQGMLPPAWFASWLAQLWQQGLLMAGLVLLMQLVACQRLRVVQNPINGRHSRICSRWCSLRSQVCVSCSLGMPPPPPLPHRASGSPRRQLCRSSG